MAPCKSVYGFRSRILRLNSGSCYSQGKRRNPLAFLLEKEICALQKELFARAVFLCSIETGKQSNFFGGKKA